MTKFKHDSLKAQYLERFQRQFQVNPFHLTQLRILHRNYKNALTRLLPGTRMHTDVQALEAAVAEHIQAIENELNGRND